MVVGEVTATLLLSDDYNGDDGANDTSDGWARE